MPLPGTRWLIASGFGENGGLALIDTVHKHARQLYTAQTRAALDRRSYPSCDAPPDPASFRTLGVSLRAEGSGRILLYAVGQSPRLTVEAFAVDVRHEMPVPTRKGCIRMPGFRLR